MTDIADAANQTNSTMTLLLACIASVSLLVGGIGIMNIMLVSVTERTREIGIRMAIGARSSAVKTQFLIESIVLGLTGGLVGIVLGVVLSLLIPKLLGWPTLISTMAIIGSVVFSAAVGIFFGYYRPEKPPRSTRLKRYATNNRRKLSFGPVGGNTMRIHIQVYPR